MVLVGEEVDEHMKLFMVVQEMVVLVIEVEQELDYILQIFLLMEQLMLMVEMVGLVEMVEIGHFLGLEEGVEVEVQVEQL